MIRTLWMLLIMLPICPLMQAGSVLLPDEETPAAIEGCVPITSTITIEAVSSEYDQRYLAENLLDGDLSTGWSSTIDDTLPYLAFIIEPPTTIVGMLMDSTSAAEGYEADSIQSFQLLSRYADGEWGAFWTAFYEGTAANQPGLQAYQFAPFFTGDVMLELRSNYGGDYFEASEVIFCQAFEN